MAVNFQLLLSEIYREVLPLQSHGVLAYYIPELAAVNPNMFGMHLRRLEGEEAASAEELLPFIRKNTPPQSGARD